MDWKMKRRRELESQEKNAEFQRNISQNQKYIRTRLNSSRPDYQPSKLWLLSLTLLVLCHFLTPCHCFFFPKSFFRRLSSAPQSPSGHLISSPEQESLIASEQQIQPAIRIANRPNSYQSAQQPQPNPNFHVPKALCIACEKFPWMPVSGPEKPGIGEQAQPSQQQQQQIQHDLPRGQQMKTIVINALGEAKGPIPILPQQANRKPFAIQFDSSKSNNDISVQTRPSSGSNLQSNENKNLDPATRPITFQIYDPPRQPTVLKPVGNSQNSNQQPGQRFPQEPSAFMQPPPNFQFHVQQMHQQQNGFLADRLPSMSYGRPTVLKPVNNAYLPPHGKNAYSPPKGNNVNQPPPNPQHQQQQITQQQQNNGNHPPIPPITISTIVAAQHGRAPNVGQAPTLIQPAKLVYQEHTQIHGPSVAPYKNAPPTQYGKPNAPPPQPPQNIKMPILPRPFGNYNFQNQNEPQGQYRPPPTNGQHGQGQQRPPQGTYLPPQSQQRPIQNQNIMNLRPPPQEGRFYHQQSQGQQGHVFFPRPQGTIQYGPTRPQGVPTQGFNQGLVSQHSAITIPAILQFGKNPTNSNNADYIQSYPRPQMDTQGSQTHSSNILPIPVPNVVTAEPSNDYHQSGSNIQNQHQTPSDNFVSSPPKLAFNQPKGVVKNPHIQSIENLKHPEPSKESNQPSIVPLTQESGWEIIPALQTDITHLFNNPPPTKSIEQPKAVTVPVPLPVPIPIPESQSSKSPIFVIRGQGNQNPSQVDLQQQRQNGKIVVQGVTYHEEIRNNIDDRVPPSAQSQQQTTFVTAPPTVTLPYSTQPPSEGPRVTMGIPIVQPQIILRPHPGNQFDPLPASISTALYHAQRTSYLTHQYLSQNGGQTGEKTMYVNSVPVHQPEQQRVTSNFNSAAFSDSAHVSADESSGKGSGVQNLNNVGDQVSVNCQTHQQWVTSGNNQEENTEGKQLSPAATNTEDEARPENAGNERKPYLIYYPTPVRQSPIYWVQPPQQSSQGVLRLRPQAHSPEDESKQSSNSVAFSPAIQEWSTELATPSVDESPKPDGQSSNDQSGNVQNHGESQQDDKDVDDYSYRIPYGQRLPVRTTVTPFDIISIGENASPVDDVQAQSLEHEEETPRESDTRQEQTYQESRGESESNKNDGQNNLNEFSSGSQGYEPSSGAILKPVSTTVIHSPESTSYATQSFKFPSFRPQKVIFHDFTNGGGISTLLQQQQQQQQEDRAIGQQSQNVQSWRAFYRPKSPKFVENDADDSEEAKQSIASGSSKVVHYQSSGDIASSPVTTAECGTKEPFTVTTSSTEDNQQTFSPPITSTEVQQNGDREKIRFRLGARFPAGRPSVTSFNSGIVPTTTTEPTKQNLSQNDSNDSQHPGSYSASISIPVYRPANAAREIHNHKHSQENTKSFSLPNNLLNLDDIYNNSEMKQHVSVGSTSNPLEEDHTQIGTTQEGLTSMSTEKSSSFSISINERMVDGHDVMDTDFDSNTPRKVPSSSRDFQKVEVSVSHSQGSLKSPPEQSVHIVTSVPAVASDYEQEPISITTTTTPSSANTSTKIVKTVRVRQRMRPGGGNINGTIRNRFNGPGRIRVVQRPVTPDYIKHFPEFVTSESEKLAKEEEEEVKNALIELKRSERAIKV